MSDDNHVIYYNSLQAERDFSIKNSLETQRRKLAGPDYVYSAMFTACNKKHLAPLINASPASVTRFTVLLERARQDGCVYARIPAAGTVLRKRRRADAILSDSDSPGDDDEASRPPRGGVIDLSDDEDDVDEDETGDEDDDDDEDDGGGD
jgi:hypothetical protein